MYEFAGGVDGGETVIANHQPVVLHHEKPCRQGEVDGHRIEAAASTDIGPMPNKVTGSGELWIQLAIASAASGRILPG